MTDRDRQLFLLRRLGFGAGTEDQKLLLKGSWQELLEFLLTEPDQPDLFSPYPFLKQDDGQLAMRVANLKDWWITELVCSPHVLRERMVLFWHDHLAVDLRRISPEPALVQHLQALRTDPLGSFEEILKRMTRDPAFMKYLNIQEITKRKPNENFGRELMELYTLGIGSYTEADIKGASRAITGWSLYDNWRRSKLPVMERMQKMAEENQEWVGFNFRPEQHDEEPKTILGQTRNWGGSEILVYLAQHPQTARFICGKLFFHFVGRRPVADELNAMTKEFQRSGTGIGPALRKMVELPGFWEHGREGIKTPAEFVVGLNRAAGVGSFFRKEVQPLKWSDLPPKSTRSAVRIMGSQMQRMGMDLMAPVDVSGFPKGEEWINTSNALVRRSVRPQLLDERQNGRSVPGPGLKGSVEDLTLKLPDGQEAVVKAFCDRFDAPEGGAAHQALMAQKFTLTAKSTPAQVTQWLIRAWGALCASPDFQMR